MLRPALAEFIGVIFLVYAGVGSIIVANQMGAPGYVGLIGIALAHGVALSIAVSATMNISGAHINPAVSIAMYLTRKIDAKTLGVYVVVQLLGAIVGAAFAKATYPAGGFEAVMGGTPALAGTVGVLQGVVMELILTFFLVFAIWGTAASRHAPAGIAGFGIGLTVFFDILIGGPITGAAMNPARFMGPALIAGEWANWWVYWIGPVLGASLAAAVYEGVLEKKD